MGFGPKASREGGVSPNVSFGRILWSDGAKPELFGHDAQLEGKGKACKRQHNCEVVGGIRRTLEILKENPISPKVQVWVSQMNKGTK